MSHRKSAHISTYTGLLLCGTCLAALPGPALATTYYAAPSGSDSNNGSAASPWKTLQSAVTHLKPGDTLNVEPGKYAGFIVCWDAPTPISQDQYGTLAGTAAAPITIQADPSAAPGSVIINSGNSKTHVAMDIQPGADANSDCAYLVLKGFTIDGSGLGKYPDKERGINITSSHVQALNNTITGIDYGFGIASDGASNLVIANNTISGTGWHNNGNYGHGIYIANGDGIQVAGNTLHDNAYIGLHINGDPNVVSHALIENNVIYNNGQNGINADGLQSSTVKNNLIYGYQNYGIALYQIDSRGPSKDNTIVNNTIASPQAGAAGAIRILNKGTGNTILNNILLGGGGITYRISADSMSGLVSDDNVVGSLYQSEDTGASQSFAQWQASAHQDAHSFIATPAALFVNPGSDFHLLATSPAIDKGTSTVAATDLTGTARPQGAGFDIGAYEYASGVPTPAPAPPPPAPAPAPAPAPVVSAPTGAAITASTTNCQAPCADHFNGSVQGSNLGSVTYSWLFGDNTTGSGASVSHTYVNAGRYTVTLVGSNPAGSASAASTVTVTALTPTPTPTPSPTPTPAPPPSPSASTLWPGSAAPANSSDNDSSAVELGVKFKSDKAGYIKGIRFYKGAGNTGTHLGNLWSTSGKLLARARFANESASGWQQVNFAKPVAIQANTVYVASYHTNAGHYADDQGYFASGIDHAPLHALADGAKGPDGVYRYGSSGFPTSGYNASNYWVDVVFSPQ